MATGIKFTHAAHIAPKIKPKSATSHMWGMLTAGLACGFLGMYFTVTQPMASRMQLLETDIALMQTEMHQLVGTRDDLWKTNDLLTGLRQQQRQLAEAQQALASIRHMRNDLVALMDQHELAMSSLTQVAGLQASLIGNHADLVQSREAVTRIETLQQDLVALGTAAEEQQGSIAMANQTLDRVEALASKAMQQEESLAMASSVIDTVDRLTGSLMAREEPLAMSAAVVRQVESLQDQLQLQAEQLPRAAATLEQMTALENQLASRDPALTKQAQENLAALTHLGRELSTGTARIASAVQTIELLEDFQTEVTSQAEALTNMRRDLMEITFLESTVKQTLQVLKPLIQLTDMRRMSDAEVREAARVIIDRRIADSRLRKEIEANTRMAERDIPTPRVSPREDGTIEERQVPPPSDIE